METAEQWLIKQNFCIEIMTSGIFEKNYKDAHDTYTMIGGLNTRMIMTTIHNINIGSAMITQHAL